MFVNLVLEVLLLPLLKIDGSTAFKLHFAKEVLLYTSVKLKIKTRNYNVDN